MSLADELTKLEELRRSGALTESEFAKAKSLILNCTASSDDAVTEKIDEQLAEVRYQNELARLDREWEFERERYKITSRYGQRYIPTVWQSIASAVAIAVFGIFWTTMAFSITSMMPDFGPFALAGVIFPLCGLAFTSFGIFQGIHAYKKVEAYNRALAAYQRRRAAVKPEDFR
jgi:hypothetical protein